MTKASAKVINETSIEKTNEECSSFVSTIKGSGFTMIAVNAQADKIN